MYEGLLNVEMQCVYQTSIHSVIWSTVALLTVDNHNSSLQPVGIV